MLGCASLIFCAFSCERTVVTTEWPRSRRVSRTWAAMKPLPPVGVRSVGYSRFEAIVGWRGSFGEGGKFPRDECTCEKNFRHFV